jgi:hypothetical protein
MNAPAMLITRPQSRRIETYDCMRSRLPNCMQASGGPVGAISQNDLSRLNRMASQFLAAAVVSQFHPSEPARSWVNQYMRTPLNRLVSEAVDHRCIDHAHWKQVRWLCDAFGQDLRQDMLQPTIRFAQAIK